MLAEHVGREQTVKALGKEWKLARWTRAVWRELLEWARPQVPDPIDVAERLMKRLPPEQHAGVLAAALQMGCEPVHIGTPAVLALVNGMEGTAKLVSLLLKPSHPEATEDLAWDIILDVGLEMMAEIKRKAEGKPPRAPEGKPEAPAE